MPLSIASIRCISQVALLGCITPNLRGVVVGFDNKFLRLFFYYEHKLSKEEEELSEEVATEMISDCTDLLIETKKIILPVSEKIPQKKDQIFAYYRYEPYFRGTE